MERQAYLWNVPQEPAPHATRLVAGGTTHIRVKAGGDGNGAIWSQWRDAARTQPYRDAGLRVTPWFYVHPTEADRAGIVGALMAQGSDEIALNPETEWRVSSPTNPWHTLDEANGAALAWVQQLRAALLPLHTRIAFSSCGSWVDFPYEGFARACDQGEPQHYWPRTLLRGENQVEAHLRRAGAAKPCVPILTASREYDDAGVLGLAREALASLPGLAGFSSWEAGNAAYQWDAIAAAYALLPAEVVAAESKPLTPPAPPADDPSGVAASILPDGSVSVTVNFGGVATRIQGVDYADLGVSVVGADGAIYDRSIQGGAFQPWRKRGA